MVEPGTSGFCLWNGGCHLPKMATLPNLVNGDLSKGFTVPRVAEKHGWPEALVCSIALEDKDDLQKSMGLGTTATEC